MKKSIFTLLFFAVFTGIINAQLVPSGLMKGVDPDKMSDLQVEQMITKMQSEGVSMSQFDQYAAQEGLSKTETQKLKNRIIRYQNDLKGLKKRKKMDPEELKKYGITPDMEEEIDPRLMKFFEAYMEKQDSIKEAQLPVFGASIFQELNLSFEPNLRIATPENYILGADDELIIDIFGSEEGHFELTVTPDGIIRIPNITVVHVGGLTIAEAKTAIINKISNYYDGLTNGDSQFSLALGDIRSITVNVIGEVKYPGSYTIPSLSSVFNALYQSGGPTENGSFRLVEIIRAGKIVHTVDLYDFLVFGKESSIRLQDQDAIKVMPYQNRVGITGEIKNKALYEMKDKETLSDLITFAGGFSGDAYQERVTAYRNTAKEKSMIDVESTHYSSFAVKAGDLYTVGKLLDRFANRVQIQGAIFRPGEYALTEGMRVSELLKKAEGLSDDAFATRALVFRKDENNLPQMTSFSPIDALNGKNDILLQREDSIYVFSTLNMRTDEYIYVSGEVISPNKYSFSKGMTLKDAILMANGTTFKADHGEVEVFRQITDSEKLKENVTKAETYCFTIDKALNFNDTVSNFTLKKEDRVIVRSLFGYEDMKQIKIEGEVIKAGTYVITSKNQRISDVLEMAGGLTSYAYPEGAFLLRRIKKSDSEKEMLKEIDQNMATVGISKIQIDDELNTNQNQTQQAKNNNKYKNKTITNPNDTIGFNPELSHESDIVAIELKKILEHPGSKYDILLEEGDILNIPKRLETVQVMGEVMMPTTVRYADRRSLKSYIDESGGFSLNAKKNKVYVMHANGSVDVTKSFMGIKNYPKVNPGSRIIVPEKPQKESLKSGEIVGITTSIVSVAAMIISLFR